MLFVLDGSVSSLLEHCLGWRREEDSDSGGEEEEERRSLTSSPLLTYLHHSARPCPQEVEQLCRQHSLPPHCRPASSPLHVLLTSPNLQPDHLHLQQVVSVLLDHGLASPLSSPLLSLTRLCERRAWGPAASIAQLLLSRAQWDVNSGTASHHKQSQSVQSLDFWSLS